MNAESRIEYTLDCLIEELGVGDSICVCVERSDFGLGREYLLSVNDDGEEEHVFVKLSGVIAAIVAHAGRVNQADR